MLAPSDVGAVMFNDELTLDECKVLVSRLAECKFPFQCAHGRYVYLFSPFLLPFISFFCLFADVKAWGRPSVIPLVDLRDPVESGFGGGGDASGVGRGFVEAFKMWSVGRGDKIDDEM